TGSTQPPTGPVAPPAEITVGDDRNSADARVASCVTSSSGVPLVGSGGGPVSDAVAGVGPDLISAAMWGLPDGVALFDDAWTICYINPAGAALLGRPVGELTGRSLWVALPELAGTNFHSFLLHAGSSRDPVSWSGFYAPAGRWLRATADVVGELLQVAFREAAGAADAPAEGTPPLPSA